MPATNTVKTRREGLLLTREQASTGSGISYPHYTRIERHLVPLTLPVARRLGELLGLDPEELFAAHAAERAAVRRQIVARATAAGAAR